MDFGFSESLPAIDTLSLPPYNMLGIPTSKSRPA